MALKLLHSLIEASQEYLKCNIAAGVPRERIAELSHNSSQRIAKELATTRLDVSQASSLIGLLSNAPFEAEDKARCIEIINNEVSRHMEGGSPCAEEKSTKLQAMRTPHHYLTASEWDFMKSGASLEAKLNRLATKFHSLGLRSPNEKTAASVATVAFVLSGGDLSDGVASIQATRTFKTLLRAINKTFPPSQAQLPELYPTEVLHFKEQWPSLFSAHYSEEPPSPFDSTSETFWATATARMACRCSRADIRTSTAAVAASSSSLGPRMPHPMPPHASQAITTMLLDRLLPQQKPMPELDLPGFKLLHRPFPSPPPLPAPPLPAPPLPAPPPEQPLQRRLPSSESLQASSPDAGEAQPVQASSSVQEMLEEMRSHLKNGTPQEGDKPKDKAKSKRRRKKAKGKAVACKKKGKAVACKKKGKAAACKKKGKAVACKKKGKAVTCKAKGKAKAGAKGEVSKLEGKARSKDLILGCGKWRFSLRGCTQCRSPTFGGKRGRQ